MKRLLLQNFIILAAFTFIGSNRCASSIQCDVGCSACSATSQNQIICSQCEPGFVLVDNKCQYTQCSPFTYLQYDSTKTVQSPLQCKSVCNDYYQENTSLNTCDQIKQCSISYNSKQSINRATYGGIVEKVYQLSKKYTMVVYPSYQTLIDTNTGAYLRDLVDPNILTLLIVDNMLLLITFKNEVIFWNFLSNEKDYITQITKGRLSKKSQVISSIIPTDIASTIITSYDEGLNLVYFTAFSLLTLPFITYQNNPSLSTTENQLYITDGYVISVKQNQKIVVYSYQINKDTEVFTLLERQQSSSFDNILFPFLPILTLFYYQDPYTYNIIFTFIQEGSTSLSQLSDSSDGETFPPLDISQLNFQEQPLFIQFLQNYDGLSWYSVRFMDKIKFYLQDLTYLFGIQKQYLTDYAFFLDDNLPNGEVKMFLLYSSLNLVTTHMVDFNQLTITDRSSLLTQIQNPLSFFAYTQEFFIGGDILGPGTDGILGSSQSKRNLQFGGGGIFTLFIFSENVQKIDVENENTSFVINPFIQKKWIHTETINQMAYSDGMQLLLTCSADGSIIGWSTQEALNPSYLYVIRKQSESCRDIIIHNDQWAIALYNKSILIFNVINYYNTKEFVFQSSTSSSQQFISHNNQNILLYFDSQFSLLNGIDLTQISQSNIVFTSYNIQKIFFLDASIIAIQNGNLSLVLIELQSSLQFPTAITSSYTSQLGNISLFSIDYNQQTTSYELLLGFQQNSFIIFNLNLQVVFQHTMIDGFPFQVNKDIDNNTYVIYGKSTDSSIAYQYFYYILNRQNNSGSLQGRTYSLNLNLGLNDIVDYKSQSNINFMCTLPYTYFTQIQRVIYHTDTQSLTYGYYVFYYGGGITQYINKDSGLTQYYSGTDGTLSFDTNTWNAISRYSLISSTISESIQKTKVSVKLGIFVVVQNDINIYHIHSQKFIQQVSFNIAPSSSYENFKRIVISESQKRLYAYQNNQALVLNLNTNTTSYFSIMSHICGLVYDDNLSQIFIHGSQLLVTNIDLEVQNTIISEKDNYSIVYCLISNSTLFCKTTIQQILLYNTQTYSLINSISVSSMSLNFKMLVDGTNGYILLTSLSFLVYDYFGNQVARYDNYASSILDCQLFNQHVGILTTQQIFVYQRATIQQITSFNPSGGGNILGFYYIQDYNLIVYYSDEIRQAQIYYFSLNTYQNDGYTSSTLSDLGNGKVVLVFYDLQTYRLNYVDSYGYLYSVSMNSQRSIANIISFEEFKTLGIPSDYQFDYILNNLYLYNGNGILSMNYNLATKAVIQQNFKTQKYYFKYLNSTQMTDTVYFIFDNLNTLYTYKDFSQIYLTFFNDEIVDVKQLDKYQLIAFIFSDQILLYTYSQVQQQTILNNNYAGIITNHKISKFLSDEVYISAENVLVHINYGFYNQSNGNWQFNTIQYSQLDTIQSYILLDNMVQIVISFKSGNVVLYDQTLKQASNIITSSSNIFASQIQFTVSSLLLGYDGGTLKLLSRTDYSVINSIQLSQIITTQSQKICNLKIDSTNSRIFFSFCYQKLIYVIDINSLSTTGYLSFPDSQYNRLQITSSYIFAYSWSQVNIYKRDTLEYVSSIRKNNQSDRILSINVLSESQLIICMNGSLDVYIINGSSILLIDSTTSENPEIIDAYLSDPNLSVLKIVGLSDNTIIDKRLNLKLYNIPTESQVSQSNQVSILTPEDYSCFQTINMNDRIAGQNIFDIVYNTQTNNTNYRIETTYYNFLQPVDYVPNDSVDLVIGPSQTIESKKWINMGSEYFSSYNRTDLRIKDMIIMVPWIKSVTTYSPVIQNIYWQDITIMEETFLKAQMIFSNLQNVVFSNITIIDINANLEYAQYKTDCRSKWDQVLFLFQNCTNIVIENLIIKNATAWWRTTLFGFQNVEHFQIKNVLITQSNFYTLFLFEKGSTLLFQNITLINNQIGNRIPYSPLNDTDQSSSTTQIERYIIQINAIKTCSFINFNMTNNTNLLLLRYTNSFSDSNEQIILYNDIIQLQNIHIEGSTTSINTKLPLSQLLTQSLISISSSNITISNMTYKNNQGNIIVTASTSLQIIDSLFMNSTTIDGGALYVSEVNKVNIVNSNFMNNKASGSGGAIYFSDVQLITFDQASQIYQNTAQIGGGIRLINYGKASYEDNQIYKNIAYIFGNNIGTSPSKVNIQYGVYDTNGQLQNVTIHQDLGLNSEPIPVNNFKSGDLLPMLIQFLDDESRIVSFSVQQARDLMYTSGVYSDIKSLQIEIVSIDIQKLLVVGQSYVNYNQFNEDSNTFVIDTLKINSNPSSTQSIQLSVTTNSFSETNKFLIQMNMSFRKCVIGEIQKSQTSQIVICEQCTGGYYSIQNPQNNDNNQCTKCPTEAEQCEGNKIVLKNGYWRESNITDQIVVCDPSSEVSCQENNLNSQFGCIPGYIGPLCKQCDQAGEVWSNRYTYASNTLKCVVCSESGIYYAYFGALTILFTVYIITSVCLFMNNFIFHSVSTYLRFLKIIPVSSSCMKDHSTFYMKSLINYLQLSSILLESSFQKKVSSIVTWPDNFGTPLNNVFSDTNCLYNPRMISNYGVTQIRIFFEGIYPIFFLLLVSSIFFIMAKLKLQGIKIFHTSATLTILFTFFQPELIKFFTNALSCRQIGDKKYQTINLLISCSDRSYMVFTNFFIIPYLIVLLTLPLYFLVRIYKNREKLHYCTNKYKFGYFYLDYKEPFYFWEFIRIYTKTFIVIFFTLYKEQDINYCYQIITLFLSLTVVLNYIFNPYLQRKVLLLETMSMTVLIVCILLQQLDLMYSSQVALLFLYTFHILFIASIVLIIFYFKLNTFKTGRLVFIYKLFERLIPKKIFDLITQRKSNKIIMYFRWKKIRRFMLELTREQANKTAVQCEASIINIQQLQSVRKREIESMNCSLNQLSVAKKQKNSEFRLLHSLQQKPFNEHRGEKSSSFFNNSNAILNIDKIHQSNTVFTKIQTNQDTKTNITQPTTHNNINDDILCFTINDLENISQYDERGMDHSIVHSPPELKQLEKITQKNNR